MEEKRKRVFSGVQPSGLLTLGNYIGSIGNWKQLQEDFECIYCVVDMHAITVRQNPAELRRKTLDTLALYMACGIDPSKSILFVQSHVSQHAELSWVLGCSTMFGELSRMTQFKDKSRSHADNINGGLFTYPVLMAADILLYNADLVPIGEDQKQHLELARNVAERFNGAYSETFVVPEPYMPKVGARIKSLQEPEKKMSKSDPNENASVYILDDTDTIMRKFKRAVTDSVGIVAMDKERPGISNLIEIMSSVTGRSSAEIEKEFSGRGYGEFKLAVAESVDSALKPVREEFARLSGDKGYLEKVYIDGAARASAIAYKTLDKVYRKVGFVKKPVI